MGYEVLQTGDGGIFSTLLVSARDNSNFTVLHTRLCRGAFSGLYYHTRDYEAFYVLAGKVRFISGNESQYVREASAGTIVVCPPFCTRAYQALTDHAVLVVINFPSGPAIEFLRDWTSLPAWSPCTSKAEEMKRLGYRYGVWMNKVYRDLDITPIVADLQHEKSGLTVAGIKFSHGGILQEEEEEENATNQQNDNDTTTTTTTTASSSSIEGDKTLWLFACSSNNRLPHSIPIHSNSNRSGPNKNDDIGPDTFCVGRA